MIFETQSDKSGEGGENLLEDDEKVPQPIEEPTGKCTFRKKQSQQECTKLRDSAEDEYLRIFSPAKLDSWEHAE